MASPDAVMQRLHDEHAGALWGHCLRLVNHDRARAEDVCQETLLRAWKNASLLDETQGSALGYGCADFRGSARRSVAARG